MSWINVRAGCVTMVLFICAGITSAEDKWTDWMFTNHADIEWRWIAYHYGPDIPPNCNFQFRNKMGGKASFSYVAGYSWRQAGILDQKKGMAYQITDTEHGGDSIDKCDQMLTITVSDVKKTN